MFSSCFAYGLHIQSEVALLGGGAAPPSSLADVRVWKGRCPLPESARQSASFFRIEPQEALHYWKETGVFWVREGREIFVEAAQGVEDALLRPALLGSALAILLLQRGQAVLHASAVALKRADGSECAVAFLGSSGQGKSTMATVLHQRGHRALADDTIAVPVPDSQSPLGSRPLIFPALPHFKLRPPSVQALADNCGALPRWHPDADTLVLRLPCFTPMVPAPLNGLYLLEESPVLQIELLNPQAALMALMQHAYSMTVLPDDTLAQNFAQCARLAERVPVWVLRRPKSFERIADVARLVEEHQGALSSAESKENSR